MPDDRPGNARVAAIALIGVSVALGLFALWGLLTEAGRAQFAGENHTVPYATAFAAAGMAVVGVLVLLVSFRKR